MRSGGLLCLVVAFASTMLVAREACAANTARLVYLRGHGADTCPDEEVLRDAVAARLGYDAFSPWALDTLFTEFERDGATFVARVKLVTQQNVVRGARTLHTPGPCAELIPTLGLTISLAIDPLALTRKGPPEGLPPAERPVERLDDAPPAPPTPQPDEAPTPRRDDEPSPAKLKFAMGLGALGTVGSAPGPALGSVLFGRARWRDLSVSLEGRADLAASAEATGGGRASSRILGGSLVACGHQRSFFACPRATVGMISAEGLEVTGGRSSSAPWLEVGGRIGYELGLGGSLALRLHLDGSLLLTRYTLRIDGRPVFEHPPAAGGLGAALVASFP